VWRVLRRHGLNTRARRLVLIAGYAAPPERARRPAPPQRHLEGSQPGELVQMDCFYVGRLQGTKGAVWQYTAIDVGSAYCWAELRAGSVKHPESRWTSALARRVASDLAAPGLASRSRHERSRHRVLRPVLRHRRGPQRRSVLRSAVLISGHPGMGTATEGR
jgi:hypothetical protein